MNKKQKRLRSYSDGYLAFSCEDSHHFNYNGKTNPVVLQRRQENHFQKTHELECCTIVDGLSKDTNNLNRVSPNDDHHSVVFKHLNGVQYVDMPKSDQNAEDLLSTPELECLMVTNDYVNHDKHEPADLVPLTSSEMFQEGRNIYTDEEVLDYEPELIVCYKEMNYKFVKDICVDEGMPLENKGSFDNYSGPCGNEYDLDEESGDLDFELLIHDDVSLEADADVHNTKECLPKEERNIVSSFASEYKSLADLMSLDDQNHDTMFQHSEKSASKEVEGDAMHEESIVTKLVHMENFGSKCFLRSPMKSLSNQEDEAQHLQKVVEHGADMDKRRQESVVDSEYGDYSNNPSIDSGVVSSILNRSSKTIHQEPDSYYEEDCSTSTSKAQRAGMDGNTSFEVQIADVEQSSVNIHPEHIAANSIVDSENPFPFYERENFSESRSIQKSPQQLQDESCGCNECAHSDVPSSGVNDVGGIASSTTPGEACYGEVNDIAASGPATVSGSTSMRSESSTTSARSFAFPVLQTEGNSSPARMGNANRRRFRKKRGSWKRHMLCCRF